MAMTADQVAQKWRRNTAAATESYREGVQAVTVSPTELAAANVDRQVEGVRRAAESGKTQAALRRISLQDWKASTIDKGASRLASGAAAAEPKMQSFMVEFLPYVRQGAEAVAAMPKGTIEDGIARATAMIRHNAQFRRTRS